MKKKWTPSSTNTGELRFQMQRHLPTGADKGVPAKNRSMPRLDEIEEKPLPPKRKYIRLLANSDIMIRPLTQSVSNRNTAISYVNRQRSQRQHYGLKPHGKNI